MNTKIAARLNGNIKLGGGKLLTAGALALILTACASTPPTPDGAVAVREDLTALQNNPNLNDRARVELREAEEAVRLAETPVSDDKEALAEHRVYMAERKVAIAKATATKNYAESQREALAEAREEARLRARTLEANRARAKASRAEAEAREARLEQAQTRAQSAREAEELQERIAELEAESTERGLVLTLGDVLFATGSAKLQSDANSKLDKVVEFLNEYPERNVVIEGHTDDVGEASYNQLLSQQRADAVRAYFSEQGISSYRINTRGLGESQPVASNDNPTGRQQNRRVEIIIQNAPQS